jgi:hypothetical protein
MNQAASKSNPAPTTEIQALVAAIVQAAHQLRIVVEAVK